MERSEIDYSKMVYKSGNNKYFDFNRFGPLSSFYLRLMNGNIGNNAAKLSIEEFGNEIYMLKNKKAKKELYKRNKKNVLENAEALYNGLNIIEDAFEKRIFEHEGRPMIHVDYETSSDTYHLTNKELQMFKKLFKYNNPSRMTLKLYKML